MPTRYKTVADLPSRIPLFPLVGALLLPRASLPLNIFEPRFLAMVDDAMRGDRVIGIIQPDGDGGTTGSPENRAASLRRIGCVGRITTYQEKPDGRLLIVLTGVARFALTGEVDTPKPYRIGEISSADFGNDLQPGSGEAAVDREKLLDVLSRYLAQNKLEADWQQIGRAGTEFLVNWLSIASPFAPQEKQALLEAPTLAARADVLVALAEMAMAGSASGGTRLQ